VLGLAYSRRRRTVPPRNPRDPSRRSGVPSSNSFLFLPGVPTAQSLDEFHHRSEDPKSCPPNTKVMVLNRMASIASPTRVSDLDHVRKMESRTMRLTRARARARAPRLDLHLRGMGRCCGNALGAVVPYSRQQTADGDKGSAAFRRAMSERYKSNDNKMFSRSPSKAATLATVQ